MISFPQPWIKGLHTIFAICAITFLINVCLYADGQVFENKDLTIKRSDFPSDFVIGVATSALQIEGSANKGGRTPSIWDTYAKIPGKIRDGSNCSKAIDSYKRYKEDVKHIKDIGVQYYRFSISWSRILPKGSLCDGVNKEGIDHYNNLINELIKNGITPFVTILNYDTPQILQDKYGGFLNRSIVDDFKDYSELLFETYGDRVKNWITINAPFMSALGYDLGIGAPGRCSLPPPYGPCPAGNSSTEPYIVGHNHILAHATAAKLYKEKFQARQHGQIGITHLGEFPEPLNPKSSEDKAAAKRYLDFLIGWFVEPLVFGDYPLTMRNIVKERLPTFTEEEKILVKGSFDFIGINFYSSRYVTKADPVVPPHLGSDFLVTTTDFRDGYPIGQKDEGTGIFYNYPHGLQKLLEFMKRKYQNPVIYITENGMSEGTDPGLSLEETLKDPNRIKFILENLYYANKAMKNGVNLKGYFYWSLVDSFEWSSGYAPRFGLYFIDYKNNYKRIPKESAKWFHSFVKGDNTTQLTLQLLYPSPPPPLPILGSASTLNGLFAASAAAAAAAAASIFGFFALF